MKNEKLVFSPKELAEYLGIGLNKSYKLTHTKGFPVIVLGRKRLIYKALLEKWLEANSHFAV